jgi:hypothetical protein
MMNQFIFNTKPAAYQLQLKVIKDQRIKEAASLLKDNIYVFEAIETDLVNNCNFLLVPI